MMKRNKKENYIKYLANFYDRIQNNELLNPTHISLYLAIFQFWNINECKNPIYISRSELMKLSRIASFTTYHKCINDLVETGFIEYFPSYNPYKGTRINIDYFLSMEVVFLVVK